MPPNPFRIASIYGAYSFCTSLNLICVGIRNYVDEKPIFLKGDWHIQS